MTLDGSAAPSVCHVPRLITQPSDESKNWIKTGSLDQEKNIVSALNGYTANSETCLLFPVTLVGGRLSIPCTLLILILMLQSVLIPP